MPGMGTAAAMTTEGTPGYGGIAGGFGSGGGEGIGGFGMAAEITTDGTPG
jgi:hypothetical protein